MKKCDTPITLSTGVMHALAFQLPCVNVDWYQINHTNHNFEKLLSCPWLQTRYRHYQFQNIIIFMSPTKTFLFSFVSIHSSSSSTAICLFPFFPHFSRNVMWVVLSLILKGIVMYGAWVPLIQRQSNMLWFIYVSRAY